MPTHLGGDYEQTPFRSMEDHLARLTILRWTAARERKLVRCEH
jgi:hypothetical protein